MKAVALISGGKDSIYAMMEAERHGHEIVALANLYTSTKVEEVDSFMFQSVGSQALVPAIAQCMDLPLRRIPLLPGSAKAQGMQYSETAGDEVEDMYDLLAGIKEEFPDITAVISGAIYSNYQRHRVENVCKRLGLIPLAYLWRRKQDELMQDMINSKVDAVLIKVASMGLVPAKHLGKSLAQLQFHFHNLNEKYQFHICGEGGEYETMTLDCPLYKKRIVLDKTSVYIHSDDMFAPVGILQVEEFHLQDKEELSSDCNGAGYSIQDVCKRPREDSVTSTTSATSKTITAGDTKNVSRFRNQVSIGLITPSESSSLVEEIRQVFDTLLSKLEAQGLTTADIFLVHLYVRDMANFATINEEYCKVFGSKAANPASRSCVQVPINCSIALDALAESSVDYTPRSSRSVLHVQSISSWAPTCIGPYSQANTLREGISFVAGQIGLVPETMVLAVGKNECETLELQLNQAFKNTARILDSLDSNLHHVLGMIVFNVTKNTGGRDFREILVDNAGEDDRFSNDDNSDEESEEEVMNYESRKLNLARTGPMLQVGVEVLPKNALVETEVICYKHSLFRHFPPSTSNLTMDDNVMHSWIPRKFSHSFVLVSAGTAASVNVVEKLEQVLRQASLGFRQVALIRVFYTSSSDLKQAVVDSIKSAANSAISCLPATYLISEKDEEYELAIQCIAYDFDKLETDMWLRRLL